VGQQMWRPGVLLVPAVLHAPAAVARIQPHSPAWGITDWLQLAVVVVCLFLSAFASRSETALTAVNRYRARHLSETGAPGSDAVAYLLKNPNQFLSAILILNTVAIIVASEFGAILSVKLFGDVLGSLVSGIGISILVLMFCELVPKTLAIHTAESTALRVAGRVRLLSRVLRPVVRAFHVITSLALRLRGIHDTSGPYVSDEELIAMATVGQEQGTVEPTETVMIRNVFDFEETPAHRVMVPTTKIEGIEAHLTLREAMDVALEAGYSRLPVYRDNLDHIVGVLYLKDLLREVRDGNLDQPVTAIARPALQVPETKHVGELFRELQQKKTHIAILFDEYGGTAGLVTIEDLLEEIVGEIRDEHDIEPATIEKISDDEYLFDGLVPIEEVNEVLDMELETNGYDTIGGFINDHLGRLAVVGDEVEADNLRMTVEALEDRRIAMVRVRRVPPSEAVVEDAQEE
jgi:putative hemolysin